MSEVNDQYTERYRPVRFTPARSLQSLDAPSPPRSAPISGATSGKDARQFYDDVISGPSSSKPSTKQKRPSACKERKIVERCEDPKMINRLLKSSQNNDVKDVRLCLDKGVPVDCKDEYGWTPLMCAAQTGANQVVRYLLEQRCDKTIKDTTGRTAAGIALLANQIKAYELIEEGVKSKPKVKVEPDDVYFCEVCDKNVSGKRETHEASLSHQLTELGQREKRTMYQLPEHNRGYQMMIRSGWSEEKGLGSRGQGQKYPVKTVLRKTRACLGNEQPSKARVTHSQDEIHQKPTKIVPKRKKVKGKQWEKAMRSYLDL